MRKDKVFIVDDEMINRLILSEILSNDYEIIEAKDGVEAVETLKNLAARDLPQAILLDIMMPGLNGFEVLKEIKADPVTASIPVLFLTATDGEEAETRGLKEGAVDYVQKPFNPDVIKARIDNHVKLYHYQSSLEEMVEKKTAELTLTHERMLETLATIIEYRSLESGEHIRRTCELSRLLIDQMLTKPMFSDVLAKEGWHTIIKAAALHDVGKVGIPDNILLKPGRLTPAEFEIIKTHPVIGGNIIDAMQITAGDESYIRHCHEICRHHHERWDGTGYPDGLKGEDIPLSARIVSIVDVYDALASKRCYKPSYPPEETLNILKSGSGTQFQSEIVDCLVEIYDQFEELEQSMKDSNQEEAVVY